MLHILAWFTWYFGQDDDDDNIDENEDDNGGEIVADVHNEEQVMNDGGSILDPLAGKNGNIASTEVNENVVNEDDIVPVVAIEDFSSTECSYSGKNENADAVLADMADISDSNNQVTKVTIKSDQSSSGRIHSIVVKDKKNESTSKTRTVSSTSRILVLSEGKFKDRSTTK